MDYRLVSPQDLYKEDIPNVVRPFVAKKILYDTSILHSVINHNGRN